MDTKNNDEEQKSNEATIQPLENLIEISTDNQIQSNNDDEKSTANSPDKRFNEMEINNENETQDQSQSLLESTENTIMKSQSNSIAMSSDMEELTTEKDTIDEFLLNNTETGNTQNESEFTEEVDKSKTSEKPIKISQFPLTRIKDIIKSDPDINIVNAECVFLISKATELFLEKLGKEMHTITIRNKKKTLQKRDLDTVILENSMFEFLQGALD